MKIKIIEKGYLEFDNGSCISSEHSQDCCEYNYADFTQLDDVALETDFKEPLTFEVVDDCGFRFGNLPNKMFFVPCYSEQNGYYSSLMDIFYNGDCMIEDVDGEIE